MTKKKTVDVVIAGNYGQYRHFITEQCVKENRDVSKEYVYASSRESIMGLRIGRLIKYGTYYEREDAKKIIEEAYVSIGKRK